MSFEDHLRICTGFVVDLEKWQAGRKLNEALEEETLAMAHRLEKLGIETVKNVGGRMFMVGMASGKAEEIIPWRNVNFLPAVARSNRQRMLKHLTYFTEKNPETRMFVVTTGRKCSAYDLPRRISELHRSLSKFAASDYVKKLGIEIVFRATEFTISDTQKNEDGKDVPAFVLANRIQRTNEKFEPSLTTFDTYKGHWFHPHAHVLLVPRRPLTRLQWDHFQERASLHFGAIVLRPEKLVKPEEAVKYCFKPGDAMRLYDWELLHIYRKTRKMHLVQPMGRFRALLADLKQRSVKLGKRRVYSAGVEDWAWTEIRIRGNKKIPMEKDASHSDNILLALTSPQCRFANYTEPCAVVQNFTSFGKLVEQNQLHDLARWCRGKVAAAETAPGSPLVFVHTLPITVRDDGAVKEWDWPGTADVFRPDREKRRVWAMKSLSRVTKTGCQKTSEELERELL